MEKCPLLYSTSDVFSLNLVVMDRDDQTMSVSIECCTVINWLTATIAVCVACLVGFPMS